MFKVQRKSKGFTLIELLIVIAIIGILAAIAIPAYTGYTKKSKVSGVVNAMGAVKNAIAAYYTEKGTLNNLNLTSFNEVQNNLGITIPQQYANAVSVTNSGADGVLISVTLNNIATDVNGKTINLTGSSLSGNPTWTWGGNADPAYIPKN